MVLVLDTSGSMRGAKMDQASKALKYCLDNLSPQGPLRRASTSPPRSTSTATGLLDANAEQLDAGEEVGR